MRLGVSPAASSTPNGFSISGLRLYFPVLEPWGCMVCFAPPLFLPIYLHMNVRPPSPQVATSQDPPAAPCQPATAPPPPPPAPQSAASLGPPAVALLCVLSAWLPVSAPPTGLDECVFFNSLVVGLPYSSIFCEFWLFFVFKLLLSFFWLCEEAQCVYLRLHLSHNFSKYFIHLFLERGKGREKGRET